MYDGTQTIEWLYTTQLQVDEEWSVRAPRGFCWWADQQAQTVEIVGQEAGPADEGVCYFFAVRTEFLRDVELDAGRLQPLNDIYMTAASLAGLVYDAESRRLDL